jgi:F420-0:gamma-glutamyl ligase-like protein
LESFFGLALNIVITVFLVIDSRKHGKSPILWGILGFFFGAIALGIYLIRTDRKVLGWIITILSIIGYIILFIFIALAAAIIFGGFS